MIVEIKIPSPGESITTVELTKWLVNDSDIVEKNQDIAEIDSDKATLTVSANDSGMLKILIQEGESVSVGATIGTIDTSVVNTKDTVLKNEFVIYDKNKEIEKKDIAPAITKSNIVISPQALRTLEENNIHMEEIIPEKSKRITKKDILKIIEFKTKEAHLIKNEGVKSRNAEVTKMSSLRRKLAERLVAVKNQTAMLTTFNEADMSAIIGLRNKFKDQYLQKHGVKLSFMSFFTKAVCLALEKYPYCNAQIDDENLVLYNYVDVSVAVSTNKGLVTPVVRNAESLTLSEIDIKIEELATKARNNKISIEEMTGGTFTITNGGVFGSLLSTPILNPPQSAILGMHNIVERPVAIEGKVEIRPMMYIALSYDHRIIDGRDSVGFLLMVKEYIENPVHMCKEENNREENLLNL